MIVNLSSRNKSLTELATKIYSDDQLEEIMCFIGSINELNSEYPVECAREVWQGYRSSYPGDNNILIMLYNNLGEKIFGDIRKVLKSKMDFNGLSTGELLENVQKIDPEGEYLFLYTGRNDVPKISTHYTKDGYIITVEYGIMNRISSLKVELI